MIHNMVASYSWTAASFMKDCSIIQEPQRNTLCWPPGVASMNAKWPSRFLETNLPNLVTFLDQPKLSAVYWAEYRKDTKRRFNMISSFLQFSLFSLQNSDRKLKLPQEIQDSKKPCSKSRRCEKFQGYNICSGIWLYFHSPNLRLPTPTPTPPNCAILSSSNRALSASVSCLYLFRSQPWSSPDSGPWSSEYASSP
jgi:hypothetical protein